MEKAKDTKLTPDEQKEMRADARETATSKRQIVGEREQFANSVISNLSQMGQNIAGAVTTGTKAQLTMDEATAQAVKDMIDKLVSILQQTTQSAEQGIDGISKEVQAVAQLMKDFSSTIAQAFWR